MNSFICRAIVTRSFKRRTLIRGIVPVAPVVTVTPAVAVTVGKVKFFRQVLYSSQLDQRRSPFLSFQVAAYVVLTQRRNMGLWCRSWWPHGLRQGCDQQQVRGPHADRNVILCIPREVLECLHNSQLLKKGSAPWVRICYEYHHHHHWKLTLVNLLLHMIAHSALIKLFYM
jgi:hypothetical protein